MGLKRKDESRQGAVRIALTSGVTRKQVAGDLGVGPSTLNKWITAHRNTDVVSREDLSLAQEPAAKLKREREDLACWNQTGKDGDDDGLRAYLKRYPDGAF